MPSRTVFENSVEELGYKATRVNMPKSQYETHCSDAVNYSENSKPGYTLYEENKTDDKKVKC